jgi:hypothetical protein
MDHSLFVASNGRDVARCAAFVIAVGSGTTVRRPASSAISRPLRTQARRSEMLETAERWLAERGAKTVIAPFNGATFHGVGTQSDAFDEEPMFPFPWQPPHYPGLLEAAGCRPTYPFWLFEIDFSAERYRLASRRALEDARCAVRLLEKKRWNAEVETLRSVFNDTFRDEWEFHVMTSEEFHEFLDPIKPLLDPRQFLLAEVDGETAGFCFGAPGRDAALSVVQGQDGPSPDRALHAAGEALQARGTDRDRGARVAAREAHRADARRDPLPPLRGARAGRRLLLPGERPQPGLKALSGVVRRPRSDSLSSVFCTVEAESPLRGELVGEVLHVGARDRGESQVPEPREDPQRQRPFIAADRGRLVAVPGAVRDRPGLRAL